MLHTLFTSALTFFRESEGVVKANSLDTLVILVHALLQRNFAGWEVMEVLAGDVGASDIVFSVCLFSPNTVPVCAHINTGARHHH